LVSYIREEDKFRGIRKVVLSRICCPNRELETGSWRSLDNERYIV
jgi:hypothetical protein